MFETLYLTESFRIESHYDLWIYQWNVIKHTDKPQMKEGKLSLEVFKDEN